MTINILAFGIVKEMVGNVSIGLPVNDIISAVDMRAELEQQFPRLKELKSFMIAVNGNYATPDTVIHAGDEVAIIPPVSGG
jgi:molybdopterin converting factor small subunit